MTYVLIAIGGAGGAVTRFALDSWVSTRVGGDFPWGTLLINISGSFLLGLLFALTIERGVLSPELRAPLMIGFLGAYTTFSTWTLESWRLIEGGALLEAMLNVGGSVVLGMAAVIAGLAIGRNV
jgi:CrcB protein